MPEFRITNDVWATDGPGLQEMLRGTRPQLPRRPTVEELTAQQDFMPATTVKTVKTDPSTTVRDVYKIRVPSIVSNLLQANPHQTIVGVELEIEKFPASTDDAEAVGFDFKIDNSLRNNGIEAVSKPNTISKIIDYTKTLWNEYKISDPENFSDRTSIHVHANVTHFTESQLKCLGLIYSLTEDILFDFIGEDRKNNIFCVPWSQSMVSTNLNKNLWYAVNSWKKYTALNFAPVGTQGTVEFRHMEGHCNIDRLSNWLAIIDDLLLTAQKISYDDLYKRVIQLNTSSEYAVLMADLFPFTCNLLQAHSPNWRQTLVAGVVNAKLLSLV